jgi:hypothetical protein
MKISILEIKGSNNYYIGDELRHTLSPIYSSVTGFVHE